MKNAALAAAIAATIAAVPHAAQAAPLTERAERALESLRATARVDRVVPADDGASARLVRGALTPPTDATPARATLDLLAAHGDLFGLEDVASLETVRQTRAGSLRIVRFRQTVDGVPVLGAHLAALVDESGVVRLVAQSLADPTLADLPMLTEADAALLAAETVVRPARAPSPSDAAPVYVPTAEGLRPAYAVHYGSVPALFANWTVLVDAVTGEVLTRFNRVATDRVVMTWLQDPTEGDPTAETLDPERFLLEGQGCIVDGALPPTDAEGNPAPDETVPRLCTERFSARSCWDFHETIEVNIPGFGPANMHVCTEYHMALPNDAPVPAEDPDDDLDNDYYYLDHTGDLDYGYADDPAAGQDLFAEPSLLFHMERIHAYFETFGADLFDGLQNGQILASANWRIPLDTEALSGGDMTAIFAALMAATNPEGQLFAFDNAMFMPGGNLFGVIERDTDSLIFFQGHTRDFAYDSDVVYHEFTHAVVGTVVHGIGLGVARRDEQGMHRLSMAMNEAYADFFACARNDDSVQGAYALEGPAMPGGRDLAADPPNTCPERLVNEEHHDSAPYSEALWAVRQALDHGGAEAAIFAALTTLMPNADFRDGANATVAAIEAELGPAAAATAEGIFERYGYDSDTPCERIVDMSGAAIRPQLGLFAPQTETFTAEPYAPSIVQFRYELPDGARQIWVRWQQGGSMDPTSLLGGGSAVPALLVRHGDEPLTFNTTGAVSSNADVLVQGPVEDPDRANGQRLVYHLDGEALPGGTYYLMLVNEGDGGGTLVNIAVDDTDEMPDLPDADGDGDGDADADADADADEGGDAAVDAAPDGGDDEPEGTACGCRAAGADGSPLGRTLRSLLPF